jgi:hypothetical protein
MDKAELVITALQQRIGELVSEYETKVAILRAEITQIMSQNEEKSDAVREYNEELLNKVEEI